MRGLQSVTLMDVFDDYALGSPIKEKIYTEYPDAKLAQLKSGGNFPYLSRSEEVNLHLQVNIHKAIKNLLLFWRPNISVSYFPNFFQIHLRKFDGTPYSASDNIPVTE